MYPDEGGPVASGLYALHGAGWGERRVGSAHRLEPPRRGTVGGAHLQWLSQARAE